MKSIFSAALAALLMLAGNAQAATQTTQQNKMVTCNKQAGAKKGDERATFMKHCLSSGTSTTTHHHKKTSTKSTHTHKKTATATTTAPAAAAAAAPAESSAPASAVTPSEQ